MASREAATRTGKGYGERAPTFAAPTSEAAVVEALSENPGARLLAGGGVMVPMLRRAGNPEMPALISLRQVASLRRLDRMSDGRIRIGAMVSHAEVARADLTGGAALVGAAAREIAHPIIRNMATIGGTVALADPAADYASALLAAGAEVECLGPNGVRRLALEQFHTKNGRIRLGPDELILSIILPAPSGAVSGYARFSRVDGDYPAVTVGVRLLPGSKGKADVRLAIGGFGPAAFRVPDAERVLSEKGKGALAEAGAMAAAAADPPSDLKGSAAFRRRLIPVLMARALEKALAAGREGAGA